MLYRPGNMVYNSRQFPPESIGTSPAPWSGICAELKLDSLLPNKFNLKGVSWYCLAGIGLLILAAGLRFYRLNADPLRHDELVVALNSRGSLSEVLANTRQITARPFFIPWPCMRFRK